MRPPENFRWPHDTVLLMIQPCMKAVSMFSISVSKREQLQYRLKVFAAKLTDFTGRTKAG